MTSVKFRDLNGDTQIVDAIPGLTLMELAVQAGVPFVIGECGGALACATCHVWVDAKWWGKVGDPSDFETDMLDGTDMRGPRSRLCCQIKITKDMDGLTVAAAGALSPAA